MDKEYWFSLFAVGQGSFVLGITLFIFGYYIPKKKIHLRNSIRWYVILVTTSYILLTFATVNTAAQELYDWGKVWYWVVTISYIMGDISLLSIFREVIKSKNDNK